MPKAEDLINSLSSDEDGTGGVFKACGISRHAALKTFFSYLKLCTPKVKLLRWSKWLSEVEPIKLTQQLFTCVYLQNERN